jgi:hypothetical protein
MPATHVPARERDGPGSRTRNDKEGDRIGHMPHTVAQSYRYTVASSCVRLIAARYLLVVRPHTSLRPAQTPRTRRDDAHAGFQATPASVRCGPHGRSESTRTPRLGGIVGLLRRLPCPPTPEVELDGVDTKFLFRADQRLLGDSGLFGFSFHLLHGSRAVGEGVVEVGDCLGQLRAPYLSEELQRLAREGGDTTMVVSATPSLNTVRFYLHRGFEPTAEPLPELYGPSPRLCVRTHPSSRSSV